MMTPTGGAQPQRNEDGVLAMARSGLAFLVLAAGLAGSIGIAPIGVWLVISNGFH